jgi:hypothetical protein
VGEVSRKRDRRSSAGRSAVDGPVAAGGSSCSSLNSELADTLEHWCSSPVAA